MSSTPDNPFVFPVPSSNLSCGATLRDFHQNAAIQAATEFWRMASPGFVMRVLGKKDMTLEDKDFPVFVAHVSGMIADAILVEREKHNSKP